MADDRTRDRATQQGVRDLVRLLKTVFDEALLAGFSQDEALKLTSMTLELFLKRGIDETRKMRGG